MQQDKIFTQWASLFANELQDGKAVVNPISRAQSKEGMQYSGVTPAAGDLLGVVDAGGVPAFVTVRLIEIAQDNGVDVSDHLTPNEIIEAIRSKVHAPSSD